MSTRKFRREVERLEKEERRRQRYHASKERMPADREVFWEMQMAWTALHLLRGAEPDFTLDKTDAFVTLDGRFAVGRHRMDLRGLMGQRTEAMQERMPPERWGRFLAADGETAELLERLLAMGESAIVPEDYKTPLANQWTQEEVEEHFAKSPHMPTAIFLDADEREATRRLTWTLIHNSDVRVMLSEVTRRRDAFVREEGSMPTDLPPY